MGRDKPFCGPRTGGGVFRKPRILATFQRLSQKSISLSHTEARTISGNLHGRRWTNLCFFELQRAIKNNPVFGADLHRLLHRTGCLNKIGQQNGDTTNHFTPRKRFIQGPSEFWGLTKRPLPPLLLWGRLVSSSDSRAAGISDITYR